IGDDFRKILREIRDSILLWVYKAFLWIRNFFSKMRVALRPKTIWTNLKSLRPVHFKLFFQNSKKWLIEHYPESTLGWLLVTAVFLGMIAIAVPLLPEVPIPPKPISPKIAVPELQKMMEEQEAPNPEEGLHVVAYTPAGAVSENIEGIKVLFDHSMIPMTEV